MDVPNPRMRKKYDLPTNEKNLKKSQKGRHNDRMDVPNPEMRMRHQVGRSKPTKRGLKKCLLKKVKQGAVQRPS